ARTGGIDRSRVKECGTLSRGCGSSGQTGKSEAHRARGTEEGVRRTLAEFPGTSLRRVLLFVLARLRIRHLLQFRELLLSDIGVRGIRRHADVVAEVEERAFVILL